MAVPRRPSSRVALLASGIFFCAYLTFQIIYPTLWWFFPGYRHFTWRMYSGREPTPAFTAIFTDGTRREVGNPTSADAAVRLFSTSVDERTVIPPWLCANWDDVRAVAAVDRATGDEELIPCGSSAR